MIEIPDLRVDVVQAGRIRLRVAQQGKGPLVLFCHGFPESWRAWRSQLAALSAAGYRVAAPDMRGYGGSDAPAEVESYTMLHLVGDMVELVRALGETSAVIVGHDWGAPVAWHCALLRPDMFRAVVGMSVAYAPPAATDLLTALERRGVTSFYMQYFQAPGVAEAELDADPRDALTRLYFTLSGEGPDRFAGGLLPPGGGLLANTVAPERLPDWLPADDLAADAADFARGGFRGGLNWYRNFKRSAELLSAWRGRPIAQPSLFIAGSRDDVLRYPGAAAGLERLGDVLPGLRGRHILEGAGHWVQRERAADVNRLLLQFLEGL